MGAIARQVLQVKRKNSTNWLSPEAKLTVLGSVASRFGPREVATGSAVGARASVGAGARVGAATSTKGVALGAMTNAGAADGTGASVTAAGAHAANRRTSRLRLARSGRRFFFILSFGEFIADNPYETINKN